MSTKLPPEVSEYFAAIGAKGGKTTGAAKRRPKAHYERLAAAKRLKTKERRDEV